MNITFKVLLRHGCVLLALGIVVPAGCSSESAGNQGSSSAAAPTAGVATSTSPQPDRAGPVAVGKGRQMYLKCTGSGAPTVVLVSGLGDNADVWSTVPATATPAAGPTPSSPASSAAADAQPVSVYDGVGKFSRVCAYDRPGTGNSRSTPVQQPTTAQTSADDLEALLTASGEAPPFVMVGHSYGGPIIRIFTGDHPDQVAALVLVDALSEDLEAGLTRRQRAVFQALNAPPPRPGAEFFDTATVFAQLRQTPTPPDMPVTVLTADIPQLASQVLASGQLPPGVDQQFADALWAAQMTAQDLLPAKFQHAKHITATNSDHYIQFGNPQLVIDSIRDVIAELNGPEPGR